MKNHSVVKLAYREEVKPSDLGSVREIVCSSGFFSDAEVEIALELVNERLNKGIASGYHFMFAEHAGKVIGYTCFGPIAGTEASYDLYWVAVRDDFRGLGIGKKLLAKTEKGIAEMGGRRIYIETSSRERYELTRSFYKSCGYQEEALLKDFYAPGDAKIIYVKEISTVMSHVFIKD
jgi:D-alanine-D-alanine ligase